MVSREVQSSVGAPPVEPLDRLRWEHALLLKRVGELSQSLGRGSVDAKDLTDITMRILNALERHQEAEERYLFPLVSEKEGDLFAALREEHGKLLRASDVVLSLSAFSAPGTLSTFLSGFKSELENHFYFEESEVFVNAPNVLSPAQFDILRIKFASRKVMEI